MMDPDFLFHEDISHSLEFTFDDSDDFFGLLTPSIPSKKEDSFDLISVNANSTSGSISETAITKAPQPKTIAKKIDKKEYSFPCPLCNHSVQPYNVKGDEIIFMCLNKQCIFPYNMKSEIREFKTTENKLKRVHLYLQNKYAGRHHNKDSDGERDHLDPQKKLKK